MTPERLIQINNGMCPTHEEWKEVISQLGASSLKAAQLQRALDALRGVCERLVELIPTNWLDPLLTGPNRVIGELPANGQDIEQLLLAIKERQQQALAAANTGLGKERT